MRRIGNDKYNTLSILKNYYPNEDDQSKCYKYDITTCSALEFPEHYYFDPNTKNIKNAKQAAFMAKNKLIQTKMTHNAIKNMMN